MGAGAIGRGRRADIECRGPAVGQVDVDRAVVEQAPVDGARERGAASVGNVDNAGAGRIYVRTDEIQCDAIVRTAGQGDDPGIAE